MEMYYAMNHLIYVYRFKLKYIVCDKTVYTVEDAALLNISPFRSLQRASDANEVPFVLFEMDTVVMRTLKIEKHLSAPLEVFNIDDTGSSCVGHITPIFEIIQDFYLIFGSAFLKNPA